MYLVYIDDSGDNDVAVFSAIMIPESSWHNAFDYIAKYRKYINKEYGIFIKKELHAYKFVAGRGKVANHVVNKSTRCKIYNLGLKSLTKIEGIKILNAVSSKDKEDRLFERLLNRINSTSKANGMKSIIISDEGKEYSYLKLRRKMGVFNQISSKYGSWGDGEKKKNITLDYVVEDIVFKDSKTSWFIQMSDFVAYALFRKEYPLASKTKYGLDKSFDILDSILVKEAYDDPLGIIRA